MTDFARLIEDVSGIIDQEYMVVTRLERIAALLHDKVEDYNCVAFFLVDPDNQHQLILGPQIGHGLDPSGAILFGQGLCGQVAERGITMVVDDVTQELNYVPDHTATKSEIVLPIFRNGQVMAELLINSLKPARFSSEDQLGLEEICLLLTDQI
ncbi:GAF domain-containing protein [bacterium]|nr:GAF domain-containing protein [bacterium]